MAQETAPKVQAGALVATFDLLYWTVHEEGLNYAVAPRDALAPSTPPLMPRVMQGAQVKNVGFGWGPGWRGSIGYKAEASVWQSRIVWTRYQHIAQREKGAALCTTWLYPAAQLNVASGAKARWGFKYEVINLELAYLIKLGKTFHFRPHSGLQSVWINQRLSIDYFRPAREGDDQPVIDKLNVHLTNNFFGLGMQGGLGTTLRCRRDLSVVGELEGALFWGVFKVHNGSKTLSAARALPLCPVTDAFDRFHALRGSICLALGVQWERELFRKKLEQKAQRLGCYFGCEQQIWLHQNQLLHFSSNANADYFEEHGDLGIFGWVLRGKWDF